MDVEYNREEEDYSKFQYIIELIFTEELNNVYFFDDIPSFVRFSFNKNLEDDFASNIEYILLYDDSIDNNGVDGIAVVKKLDEYYLIIKEHRKKTVVYPMVTEHYFNNIQSMYVAESTCFLIINYERKDNLPPSFFRFYNIPVLLYFVEFYNQFEAEFNFK